MGKLGGLIESQLSRRGFLRGVSALGAAVAVSGCSKDDGTGEVVYVNGGGEAAADPLAYDYVRYGTSGHNCGSKCIIKAYVKNGRIVRFATDENEIVNGTVVDPNNRNCAQSRACPKCRGYKYRIYHPGRLKYPLKQTIKRGDLSGFVRISWEQALNEISRKHKAIKDKYGVESVFLNYACGAYSSGYQGGGFSGVWAGNTTSSVPGNLLGGYTTYFSHYSFHQQSYFGNGFTGYTHNGLGLYGATTANEVAGVVKNVVLWGSNILTTVNSSAYPEIKSTQDMRERGGKVWFVGPEFVDTGVTLADTWVQMKPYTDAAVMNAMLYHLITNTYDANGVKRIDIDAKLQLDINYLDSMVYGFFDSPAYYIETIQYTNGTATNRGTTLNSANGTISTDMAQYPIKIAEWTEEKGTFWVNSTSGAVQTTAPSPTSGWTSQSSRWQNVANTSRYSYTIPYTKVDAVPAGKSLSAYIMGNDERLTKVNYADAQNYTAQQFSAVQTKRNVSASSYTSVKGADTKYLTKKDYNTPKTPEWAEAISGVPAATIRELAELYVNPDNHPIYSEWCGAQQKQAEGCIHFFILQTLLLVTKTWGQTGDNYGRAFGGTRTGQSGSVSISMTRPTTHPLTPIPSCTAWHNAIKFAFGDKLKDGGYTGKFIPDWTPEGKKGQVYHQDGGTKALVKWKRNDDMTIPTYTDAEGNTFYEYEKDAAGNPIYSGLRFIMNPGGNILMNQHMNSNDSREMFECIPVGTADPDNADDLCIVSFDNFLSPTPRWSDYVLPAATNWEQEDIINISFGNGVYVPVVSNPPGESKSMWNFTNEFLKSYEKVDTSKAGIAKVFTGGVENKQIEDFVKESFATASNTSTSPYYRKTWDEFLSNTYLPSTASTTTTTAVTPTATRTALENYLALPDATRCITPLIGGGAGQTSVTTNTYSSGGYGNQFSNTTTAPQPSLRFHVYSGVLVWKYSNQFSQWHGYLPAAERGQKNVDMEGDDVVYPIPMYFAYQDYHMEAYGGVLPENPLCLTTTHSRYRAHSSQAENPFLRELTHRTRGGKLYSGNDWNEYALVGDATGATTFPRLNKAIQEKKSTASWSEIWINTEDAAARGIADGDLVLVKNPVGAVRCIARVTTRCVKGMVGLHQGCWYDPDPTDGVDDGGNCNTLMASKPSRIDHGNGQQSAMVSITKVIG